MTDYPEWLVSFVAVEIDCEDEPEWSKRVLAKNILDKLGFKRDADYGHLIGSWLHHTSLGPQQKLYDRWVAKTEWKEVDNG